MKRKFKLEFNDISDFYDFDAKRKANNEEHTIRAYIKSINVEVAYLDEYNIGLYCWYVVNGKFLNYLETLDWHPLEDYIEN